MLICRKRASRCPIFLLGRMPMPNIGSHSTFSSNAISVPGNRQTATCGSPIAAKPRVSGFAAAVGAERTSVSGGPTLAPVSRVGRLPYLLSRIRHAPNRATGVVRDQQRPVLHYCQGSGASPHLGPMLTRDPEARHEIFVASVWSAIFESHSNNFVARRLRTIPRTLKRYECIPTVFCRKLFAVVEHHVQDRRVRLEQHVWNNGRFHFFRRPMCKAKLRVGPDICIRPTVKGAFFDMSEVIGRKVVAKSVALLNPRVEFSSGWVECEGRRVAHSR